MYENDYDLNIESNVLLIDEQSSDVFCSSLAFEDNFARKGPHSIEMLTTPLMGLDEENNSFILYCCN